MSHTEPADAEQIRSEIEETRAELADTVERRPSPWRGIEEAW